MYLWFFTYIFQWYNYIIKLHLKALLDIAQHFWDLDTKKHLKYPSFKAMLGTLYQLSIVTTVLEYKYLKIYG